MGEDGIDVGVCEALILCPLNQTGKQATAPPPPPSRGSQGTMWEQEEHGP